ncbi:hypothetical protein HQQ80_21705 [Microbacteriaceae bacterium VKM Ac-2855]|nr:hypothetical protein [Microbacteriaceae bacterium VKM Ac-2855]
MTDQELFKLCKEVYEKSPAWNDTSQCIWNGIVSQPDKTVVDWAIDAKYINYSPLYTSDYLLGKLPKNTSVEKRYDDCVAILDLRPGNYPIEVTSDTPLKALLKLTLALHEAGDLEQA